MSTVIEVDSLTKRYGSTVAVHDVSFSVEQGEIFALLGPNGSGKTSTVECLQGLRARDGGQVSVLGVDPQREPAKLRHRLGSQLQDSDLPDRIRVGEALELFASLAPGSVDWRLLLDQWGLSAQRRTAFASLSGGQRQRLFVALALVSEPEVVFLDELTQGLDPAARRVAWDLIRAIRERGSTVVLVTHYMDEAETLADRVAVIAGGRVTALGTPTELVAGAGAGVVVRFSEPRDVRWLNGLETVDTVDQQGAAVTVRGHGPVLALVAAALVGRGIVPLDLRVERPTLEDVFLHLTDPDTASVA